MYIDYLEIKVDPHLHAAAPGGELYFLLRGWTEEKKISRMENIVVKYVEMEVNSDSNLANILQKQNELIE